MLNCITQKWLQVVWKSWHFELIKQSFCGINHRRDVKCPCKSINSVSWRRNHPKVDFFRGIAEMRRGKKEVPELSCGAVLLGIIKCSSAHSTFQLVPCRFPHRVELSCGVRNEPLVPHVSEGGRSSPGLIVSIPVEELGCFYKLGRVAVSSSCVAWKKRVFCVCEVVYVWGQHNYSVWHLLSLYSPKILLWSCVCSWQ